MTPNVWIKEITFNNGSKVSFESNDIVIIVGPNNSGKSTILREIVNISLDKFWAKNAKVLLGLVLEKTGSIDELKEFLTDRSFRQDSNGGQTQYIGFQWSVHESTAEVRWQELNTLGLADLQGIFISFITSDGRLGIANQVQSIDTLYDVPSHPIHFLHASDELEKSFSENFSRAFNSDLIVNRGAGKFIHLHVGDRPKFEPGEDRVSTSYLKRLQKLPTIQEQGDGMRSFVGLLLAVLLGEHSISLIDEPEVFLHPPQARLLGKMLATEIDGDQQLFISTHSEDFVKGLLDSNSSRVKVLRVQRENGLNQVKELTKDQVSETWKDPLLRHSNVLSGLFHSNVVLCEGDMDCRFYSSVLNALIEIDQTKDKKEKQFKSLPDPLFIHCGGKHRMPVVVKSLKGIAVPISVVCDFDILNNEEPLKKIYEELGGLWSEIESDWRIVKSQVESKKPELETRDIKSKIEAILKEENKPTFSAQSADTIRELLRKTSPWSAAKASGKAYIPNGDATKAYERLIKQLNTKKLFAVEVGEVENFDKTIGKHGPKWVNEVLLKDIKSGKEFIGAREFVQSIFKQRE